MSHNYTSQWAGADAEIQYLQLNHGQKLRYLKTGRGEPLLLIHTIRTQLDYFQKLIPLLSAHFTIYALDLPGHGYSTIEKVDYSEPFMRKSVVDFIQKMGLNNLTVAGESIGGVLALTVAAELKDRVSRSIALNPYDYGCSFGGGIRRSSLWANLIIGSFGVPVIGWVSAHLENRFLLRKVLEGGVDNRKSLPTELVKEFNRVGFRRGYRHVERSTFRQWKSWLKARENYASIHSPVVLVYGKEDWSCIAEREDNAKQLSNASVISLEKVSHFSSLEQPAEVARIITGGPL